MSAPDSSTYDSLAVAGYQISSTFEALNGYIDINKPESPYKSAVVNESQRFELWAANLGLYHGGHSSLDYRFRDAPQVSDFERQLFRDLDRTLAQLRDVLRDGQGRLLQSDPDSLPQDDRVTTAGTGHGYQHGDDESQTDSDSEEEDFNSYQDQPLAQAYLDGAIATIDRLYRVSFKIRNPAMRIGFSKARTYREVDESTGVDIIEQFTQIDLSHLQELFSYYHPASAKDYESHFLVRRLAKANTLRRQQFRYWRNRKAKFERIHKPVAQNILQRGEDPAHVAPSQVAPSQPSTATKLDVAKVDLEDDRSVISTSTYLIMDGDGDMDLERPYIPQPPKEFLPEKEFECPYCFTMCPKRMRVKKAWRKHVLRDLRPYVCIYEDCKEADQQYDSFSEWISHETIHQKHTGTSSSHKHTGDRQLPMNITLECPFCLLQDASLRHIGTHLQRVACFALPRSTGKEDSSEKASADSDRAKIESRNVEESEMASLPSHEEEEGDIFDIPPSPSLPSADGETAILTNEALQTVNDSKNVWNTQSSVAHFLQRLDGSTDEVLSSGLNSNISTTSTQRYRDPWG